MEVKIHVVLTLQLYAGKCSFTLHLPLVHRNECQALYLWGIVGPSWSGCYDEINLGNLDNESSIDSADVLPPNYDIVTSYKIIQVN
jgi:hypothetical protein